MHLFQSRLQLPISVCNDESVFAPEEQIRTHHKPLQSLLYLSCTPLASGQLVFSSETVRTFTRPSHICWPFYH